MTDAVPLPVLEDAPRRRSTTVGRKDLARELRRQRELGLVDDVADLAELYEMRPRTRGDCEHGERPCAFVSCKHHLAFDVNERTGSIKQNFPGREVWELPETCALDVADRGGLTLEQVAELLNLTRERIRQMEDRAIAAMRTGVENYKPAPRDHSHLAPPPRLVPPQEDPMPTPTATPSSFERARSLRAAITQREEELVHLREQLAAAMVEAEREMAELRAATGAAPLVAPGRRAGNGKREAQVLAALRAGPTTGEVLARTLGCSNATLNTMFRGLVAAGKVRRIARGLYALAGDEAAA